MVINIKSQFTHNIKNSQKCFKYIYEKKCKIKALFISCY